jgi:hypothetical protein
LASLEIAGIAGEPGQAQHRGRLRPPARDNRGNAGSARRGFARTRRKNCSLPQCNPWLVHGRRASACAGAPGPTYADMRPDPQASPYPRSTDHRNRPLAGRPVAPAFPRPLCAGVINAMRRRGACRRTIRHGSTISAVRRWKAICPSPGAALSRASVRGYNPNWATGAAFCLRRCAMARGACSTLAPRVRHHHGAARATGG